MIPNAVSFFFIRPWLRVSRFCTDQVLASLIEKVRPLGKSILGKIAKNAAAETACGIAGSVVGEFVIGGACQQLGPVVIAAGALAACGYAFMKKKPLVGVVLLGAVSQCSYEQQKAAGFVVGQWVGRGVGTILGGYAGLKIVGSKVNLIDRVTPTDSYSVGMTKFILIGEIFDAAIVKASFPYAAIVVNIPRHLVKTVFQMGGYNSQMVVPYVRSCFRAKKLVQPLPTTLKMICNRYCIANSFQIASKLTALTSLKILPMIVEKGLALFGKNAILPQIQGGVEFLGLHSDLFTTIAMRSLHQYMEMLKKVDHNDLEASLKKEIFGAAAVSPVFDLALKSNIVDWANSMIESIRELEVALTGYLLLSEEAAEPLKQTLANHLKYYFIYTLLNCNKLTNELSPIEERDFFSDLNHAFFTIYTHPSNPSRIAQGLEKTTAFAIHCIHKLQRFIEQEEHNAMFVGQVHFIDEYVPT